VTVSLNDGQRAAVDSRSPRIVVSAGAGSGKTRVLAERFADAVLSAEASGHAAPLRSVLLITFTDKAAGELVERVRRVLLDRDRADLAREVDGAWISTIHGFCARIVRRHALELDVDPGFGVLADPQVGIVRFEAFERAASALLSDPAVARLIRLHGVPALRQTVLAAYDRVRSKGMCVDQVAPAGPGDIDGALRVLWDVLQDTSDDYRQLKETATVQGNLERFTALAAAVERLLRTTAAEGRVHGVVGLREYRGKLSGSAEMKELTARVNDAIDLAVQAAVDTIACGDAGAWCTLLTAYSREYEDAKALLGVLDFEDLQLRARLLWHQDPQSARRYAEQFTQVMVDEFQDTNGLQFQAIEPVAVQGLCLVGDVQQSIYRFRDADVGLFIGQQRAAAGPGEGEACQLTVNYRSHPELLETLNVLFEQPGLFGDEYLHLDHETDRPSTVDWPAGAPRAEAILIDKSGWAELSWREAEARALARRLRTLVDEKRMTPDDVVVLVRSAATMPPYVAALRAVGFDVHAGAAGGFFATPEVADARALLRVLANPLDSEGVLLLLAGGLGGLSDDALHLLATSGRGRLWDALPAAPELGLASDDEERAALVLATVSTLRAGLGRMRLADAILYAVGALGGGGGCLGHPGAQANLGKIARLAAEFERHTASDPAAFLRYLDDRESFVRREPAAGSAIEGSGAIRVMTVHAAKGLEFPVVAVADLGHARHVGHPGFVISERSDGLTAAARVPAADVPRNAPEASAWRRAGEEDDALDLAEAKRVFYVGCTRAEQVLLLTGSADLGKDPGSDIPVDWLRAAVSDAGPAGVPGLSVTTITSEEEPHLSAIVASEAPVRPDVPVGTETETPPASLRAPRSIAAPTETSYTALALYERCAYRFFVERMLGIGNVDAADGDDPRALGSALHGALQCRAEGRVVDESRLRALAAAHGLVESELPRLTASFEAFIASPAGPLLERGTAETPFAVPVRGGIVAGSMDLVVREGAAATVIDYKSGRNTIPDESRYAAQAEIYALALLANGCDTVAVRFVRVEEECAETVFSYDASSRARITERVERAFARMAEGEFGRKASFDETVCPDCPVSGGMCPIVHPGGRASRLS
jgi:ATP-dependent helicase/nuclease subunit A